MFAQRSKYLLSICLLLAIIPMSAHSAANEPYVDGEDFTILPAQVRKDPAVAELLAKDPNKVQVLLLFSYGCSACAKFDPHFEKWLAKQKDNLVSYKFPVAFMDEFESLSKLYYVMQAIDPKQNLDAKIFKEIHEHHLQLWQEPVMEEFFVSNGYSLEKYKAIYNSAAINAEVKKADQLSIAYAISQTPTVIINGRTNSYKLNLDKAGYDIKNFFKIVEFIIAKDT